MVISRTNNTVNMVTQNQSGAPIDTGSVGTTEVAV